MRLRIAILTALCCAIPGTAEVQVATKKSLTLDGARKVIAAAMAKARQDHSGGVIAVVDDGGNLMALERIDGTFAAGANVSIGKARTAALFQHPTSFFEDVIGKGRTAMVALNDFTPLQGGEPITVDGQIVGAIGVSGGTSAQEDVLLAKAGAAAATANPAPITYFERSKVDSAFAKGAVLFDGAGGANYMVHASRRTDPGQAEIHTKDADIIYVLDGTATLVTGGSALEVKSIAADEYRGSAIQGGETRQICKGDVIVVPAGTPHWFKEVTNPFLYYVVKSR